MPTPTERLELFMLRYREMRTSQNQYFKSANNVNLKIARAKEQAADDLYVQLKREGYNPDNQTSKTEQSKLL